MKICSWNINSIRLREAQVLRLLRDECPDVICFQECKSLVENIPRKNFCDLGYYHMAARGQKSYNGVAIFSKIPISKEFSIDFADLGQARHIAVRLENGLQFIIFMCQLVVMSQIWKQILSLLKK